MLKPNIPLPCKTGNRQMEPILVTYKTTLFFLFLHIHHYLQIHKLFEKKDFSHRKKPGRLPPLARLRKKRSRGGSNGGPTDGSGHGQAELDHHVLRRNHLPV